MDNEKWKENDDIQAWNEELEQDNLEHDNEHSTTTQESGDDDENEAVIIGDSLWVMMRESCSFRLIFLSSWHKVMQFSNHCWFKGLGYVFLINSDEWMNFIRQETSTRFPWFFLHGAIFHV